MLHSLHRQLFGIAVTVVLAAFAVQGLGTAPAGATSPGANGRIAFERATRFGTQPPMVVYSINADGTNIKKLVSNAVSPSWSPDGTLLAFVNYQYDSTARAIWVMNADGTGLHQLTYPDQSTQADASPTWSPDESSIAFARRSDNAGTDIWIVNADGTGLRQVTTDGMAQDPAWAPSGDRIAFWEWGPGGTFPLSVWVVDADGTGAHRITPASLSARDPSWSPDGGSIALSTSIGHNNGSGEDVWVIGAGGTGLRRLTHKSGYDGNPCWSPDGTMIAFVSARSGAYRIWTIRANGHGVHQVTWRANTADFAPDWRTIPRQPTPGS